MIDIRNGDCRVLLDDLPAQSVHSCVTSPPYFGLRDYGNNEQIGHETSPFDYVAQMVDVFRRVKRALRDDGVLWLNLGDSYSGSGKGANGDGTVTATGKQATSRGSTQGIFRKSPVGESARTNAVARGSGDDRLRGLPAKNLYGIPWRVAFALQDDGWILRSDVIWHKPNPMPSSVCDRPTSAHEYVFLFSKRPRYWFDADAIRELPKLDVAIGSSVSSQHRPSSDKQRGHSRIHAGFNARWDAMPKTAQMAKGANRRDVWTIAPAQYHGNHFATMPEELATLCILSSCPQGGTVLDPFCGAGTTGLCAARHNRRFIGMELNEHYVDLARERIRCDAPLLAYDDDRATLTQEVQP